MKLGIIVVYLITKNQEELLKIHLEHIHRFTNVPFKIYAGINRLAQEFHIILASHPNVQLCTLPPIEQTGMIEHNHYLEELTKIALADGATHIICLHVDSFPVKAGWAEALLEYLGEKTAIVAAKDYYTACFLFPRNFYEKYQPNYTPTSEDRGLPMFKEFVSKEKPVLHTGAGYLFRAYQHGLTWHILENTVRPEDWETNFEIYDNKVFHFGGGSRVTIASTAVSPGSTPVIKKLYLLMRSLVPQRFRALVMSILADSPIPHPLKTRINTALMSPRASLMEKFLKDPAYYIQKYY